MSNVFRIWHVFDTLKIVVAEAVTASNCCFWWRQGATKYMFRFYLMPRCTVYDGGERGVSVTHTFFLAVVARGTRVRSGKGGFIPSLPAFTTAARACSPSLRAAFGLRAARSKPCKQGNRCASQHTSIVSALVRTEVTRMVYQTAG